MPVFSNPSLLTTVRLKEELSAYGIDFKPNKPKKYYVELYLENIHEDDDSQSKLDFSSDEEASVRKPAPQPRASLGAASNRGSRASPARSPGGALESVEELSDAELRSELQGFGFEVGPISESTRRMCQRKLLEFRSKEKKTTARSPSRRSTGSSRVLFSDEEMGGGLNESDDDDDEEEEETDHRPAGTARTWPRLSEKQAAVPTVAQAGSTPPRSVIQRTSVRDRQRLAQSKLSNADNGGDGGWPVRTGAASPRSSGGKANGRDEADGIDVTDYDGVDRRNLLKRQSAERSGSSLAHFLELMAIGLLGFFIVIVLAFVEGPHQQLVPALPYFQSQPPADASP